MTDATSTIWKLYVFRFFSSLIPAYVIERLFWEERGMTVQMVVYTEILYAIAIVALEVPLGIWADRWGRKPMVLLSAVVGCLEFLILVYAHSFWHFAFVALLAGLGRSASSGAENALLYDTLKQHGRQRQFERTLGRLNAVDIAATILAALCGSSLAGRFDLELNYWLSLASSLIALGAALLLKEPAMAACDSGESDGAAQPLRMSQYVRTSLRFFRHRRGVSLVVLTGMVTGAAISFIDEFWQTYIDRLGIPVVYFGLFSATLFLLRLPGNMLAHALKERFSYRALLLFVATAFALGFAYVSAFPGYTGAAVLIAIGLVSGIVEPIAAGYLHHRIDSSMRATIDSFASLGQNAVLIAIGLGFGYCSDRYDIFGGFGFIAAACCLFLAYFAFASKAIVQERQAK